MIAKTGILLTNVGTPTQSTPAAVRKYLKEFLSDQRVVELPRWIWWPILYGVILPFRSKKSAFLYQKIWTTNGSPLLVYSKKLADALQHHLQCPVALGMNYGHPSIQQALEALRLQQVEKIIILPLFPQYSATTTASTFDRVAQVLKKWRFLPTLKMVSYYADQACYIQAISQSIKKIWQTQGQAQHLLFSFHGIPERYAKSGDPYAGLCHSTAKEVAKELKLTDEQWSISFQSRLGRASWLKPYTEQILETLPQKGITDLQVVCPGFAVDCLETLEEIAIRGRNQFFDSGGKKFFYIPTLNDSIEHVEMLANVLSSA